MRNKQKNKGFKIQEIPMSSMMLLPPRADVCQECACDHDPRFPHNPESFYWQMKFNMEHGRRATWNDALAHCTDEVRSVWIKSLREHGVEVVES